MKVYVDELPKSCLDCPCESEYYCNLLNRDIEFLELSKGCKDCSLQSLTDYTKQVRKEVCDNFRKTAMQYYKECDNGSLMLSVTDVWEILDQIQGKHNET